jgi:small nuclear ribonucleoprotein D3
MTSSIGIPIKLLNEAQVRSPLPNNQTPDQLNLTSDSSSTTNHPTQQNKTKQGHIVTLEITSGTTYRGKLIEAEDNMNVQLKDITVTARDGRVSHLEQVYIRGSHVRFFIVPDMLRCVSFPPLLFEYPRLVRLFADRSTQNRNAPMFRSRNVRGRGVGLARGRATVSRARAGARGR